MFQNRLQREKCAPKRNEVTGDWKILHHGKLYHLHPSPDIIRMIKSRRLRLVGHVAPMTERKVAYRVLVGRPEKKKTIWEN
jgi:hypothetical protein